MPLQPPPSGQSNVAEFMISPLPFVTQSSAGSSTPTRIDFPKTTRHFTIRNNGSANLYFGFTVSGTLGTNRFTIPVSGTFGPVDMRMKTIYLLGSGSTVNFDLLAGLTTIDTRTFPTLTESSPIALNITGTTYDPYYSYPGLG